MKKEIWKDIPGYELLYQASTYGRIRSYDGKQTRTERHGIRTWKGRILKFKNSAKKIGYRVSLWKNGKPKDFLVSRLVATTFLENLIDTKMTVNHKDGDRFNNHINNLEWLSRADNIRHAFDNGLMPYNRVKIINLETLEVSIHRSMSVASVFIGKHSGYISSCLLKNKHSNKEWKWKIIKR